MKEVIGWMLGLLLMAAFGYWTAVYAQDLVWLLIPGLGILIAIFALTKLFR